MLFNFFKKQPIEKIPEEKIIAKISYCIISNSETPIVDVELEDYNDECINALCDILDILASDGLLAETLDIIKSAIINDQKEDQLIKIFTKLGNHTKNKILNDFREKSDEPCIKPSDAFTSK